MRTNLASSFFLKIKQLSQLNPHYVFLFVLITSITVATVWYFYFVIITLLPFFIEMLQYDWL